ncbi:MAG: MOSC domain-containing protein [Bacteroidota bacterium]
MSKDSINYKSIDYLIKQYSQSGEVSWIGIRSTRKQGLTNTTKVEAIQGIGLEGDHYKSKNGKRQVTLIQAEHITTVASYLGKDHIDPDLLRRNIVIRGINLLSLKGKQFALGKAILEYTGECHPCSRMEENLGIGGYNAMRGHGGITAAIIKGGVISIGDQLSPLDSD